MKSIGLKERNILDLLFSHTISGLRNHQKRKEPGNNNFPVIYFSDPLNKVIFMALWNVLFYCSCNPFLWMLVQWTTDMFPVHISKIHFWGKDTLNRLTHHPLSPFLVQRGSAELQHRTEHLQVPRVGPRLRAMGYCSGQHPLAQRDHEVRAWLWTLQG